MLHELAAHRASEREQARIGDLLELIPESGGSALDVGARDGYLSYRLAKRFERVVALDLATPKIDHPRIEPVQGDATALAFADETFDVVVCAEVLEHVAGPGLETACREIARVARRVVVVGVPYRQDLRWGRTRCAACGRRNPPWGHVNVFDEARLAALFAPLELERMSRVGSTRERTNALSAALLDFAGDPFGTYEQDEPCVHCGAPLGLPERRSLPQRVATRAAILLERVQNAATAPRARWLHARFGKAQRQR